MKYTAPLLAFALAGALASCSDDTATLGTGVLPDFDKITTSQATYSVTSRSVKMDSVLANTSTCYLGSIVDPESHATTSCNFLAQYHMRENYSFPAKNRMVSVDSCNIRLYFRTYYGDSLTTMKLYVQELDTNKIMREGTHYYTTIDPGQYVSTTSPYKKTITSVRIPVTGMIHAGIPADAVEDIIDWEDITPDIARRGEIIALQVKGDCMEPKISDKDVVIVLQQSNCNSGDTVVAMVNSEEAMLRLLKKFEDGSINLVPTNPSYPVERFAPDEVQKLPVRIIGKVIELRAKF